MKRKMAQELHDRHMAMISGIWANPNFDQAKEKGLRQKVLDEVDEHFRVALVRIYGGTDQDVEKAKQAGQEFVGIEGAADLFSAMKVPGGEADDK